MKKIILLSVLVVVSMVALSQTAYAAASTLSVVPPTASKNVGTAFNAAVNLAPQGDKVCVVTGTLTFNNLTCRSISVDSGLMAQSAPTCSNPKFVLGIPNCTTSAKNLLTVSVKGNAPGQAVLYFSGVKVIGAGTDVAFQSIGGLYNITALPTPTPAPAPTPEPAPAPAPEPAPAPIIDNNLPATVGAASFASVAYSYFLPILVILIVLCIAYGIYCFTKRKKETKEIK